MNYRSPKPKKSQHELIVQQLGKKIVTGQFESGTKLPSEIEICEEYQVSRPVWREAIRVLASKGLITSKPRVGAVVCDKSQWHLLDPDVLHWFINSMPEDKFFHTLTTVRRVIEPEIASIAASNASVEDIAKIQHCYSEMEQSKNITEFNRADVQFHLNIAEATHNDLLSYIFKILLLPLQTSVSITSRTHDLHQKTLPRHKAILTAIENHDGIAARYASIVQLEDVSDAFLGASQQTLKE